MNFYIFYILIQFFIFICLHLSILTQYQRLAICIRRGSSTVESTMFAPPSGASAASNSSNSSSGAQQGGGSSGGGISGGGIGSGSTGSSAKKLPGKEDLVSLFAMKNSSSFSSTGSFHSPSAKAPRPVSTAVLQQASVGSHRDLHSHSSAAASAIGVATMQQATDVAVQLLTTLPCSDHALAYVVLSSGVSRQHWYQPHTSHRLS